ncbi:MAG: hypothetical protein ACRD0A_17825 [Acidimicrobiales bacterium]
MRLLVDQNLPPALLVALREAKLHVAELGRLLVSNLPAMAEFIDAHGNAIFTLAPSKPI